MAGNRKPRNRLSPRLRTQPWRVSAVFQPLESVLLQIEQTGEVTTDGKGMPMFKDAGDGHWYATTPAIEGIVEAYATHELRSGRLMPLDNLRRFAKKLEYASPLTLDDCAAVRRDLAALRSETLAMTVEYAASLVRTTQIKIELERIAA